MHPASLVASSNNSPASTKLLQHISLASKQLMIKYSLLHKNERPQDKSVKAQQMLRQLFNNWVNTNTPVEESSDSLPPSQVVHNVSILGKLAMLLKFELSAAKDQFVDICTGNPNLLAEVNQRAHICPHTYTIILQFIPCLGQFNLGGNEHFCNLDHDNNMHSLTLLVLVPRKETP